MRFDDRRHAGIDLAVKVAAETPSDPIIYGLPRGGVPVAFEVAVALCCPLEVLNVAKVGHPTQPELALGAVASSGVTVRNAGLAAELGVSSDEFDRLADTARRGLDTQWHPSGEFQSPVGKTAIVVDDGVATGATARAAVTVMSSLGADQVWLAVPVAPTGFDIEVDRLIVLNRPRRFGAVGNWYRDFSQVTADEVQILVENPRLP